MFPEILLEGIRVKLHTNIEQMHGHITVISPKVGAHLRYRFMIAEDSGAAKARLLDSGNTRAIRIAETIGKVVTLALTAEGYGDVKVQEVEFYKGTVILPTKISFQNAAGRPIQR